MFDILGFGVVVSIAFYLVFYLFVVIVPCVIVAHSIKKLREPCFYDVVSEFDDCYIISCHNMRIYKKWYDVQNNVFIAPYGFFIPQYGYDDNIVGFVFIKAYKH